MDNFPEFGLLIAMLRMFPDKEAPQAFYAATIDQEYFLSWNKTALEHAIDATLDRKAKPGGEDVNAGHGGGSLRQEGAARARRAAGFI